MLVLLESVQPLSATNVRTFCARDWGSFCQEGKDEQDVTTVLDLGEGMRNVTKPRLLSIRQEPWEKWELHASLREWERKITPGCGVGNVSKRKEVPGRLALKAGKEFRR